MKEKRKKIVFYFPWKEISGGPVYLSALANDLAKNQTYEVYYIDYKDGRTNTMLDHKHVICIQYREPFSFPFYEPITIIVPINCASHIPSLHPESKILFVNWHNYSIQALLDSWRLTQKSLQEFLSMVYQTDSVFFLDRTHWLAQNQWIESERYLFKEKYVPLTIAPKSKSVVIIIIELALVCKIAKVINSATWYATGIARNFLILSMLSTSEN